MTAPLPAPRALPVVTDRAYLNPVSHVDGLRHTAPDPFVMKHRGRYYCYASDVDGVLVSVSEDLVTWDRRGFAIQEPGRKDYWAPSAIYHNGLFHLYYSNVAADSTDPHEELLRVAVSDSPVGPFRYLKTLFTTFSIDSHVVRNAEGDFYLFYASNDASGLSPHRAGTAVMLDRMVSLTELAGQPRLIVPPTLDEEIFARNRYGDGRDWHTVEAPAYFTHHGRAYLTYSGNAYVHEDYFVGYATGPELGDLGAIEWTKFPHPGRFHALIRRSSDVEGTGHNSIVKAPNLVDDWIAYHGRDASEPIVEGTEQRLMRIDPLFYDGDVLVTNAPSSTIQDAPKLPDVRDLFIGERLAPEWDVVCGSAHLEGEALVVGPEASTSLILRPEVSEAYIAEVDLAAAATHLGPRSGVIPCFVDDEHFVEVLLDAGAQVIEAVLHDGGSVRQLATSPIRNVDLSCFHNVTVVRVFSDVEIRLDGIEVLRFRTSLLAGRLGLVSHHTRASFSAFSFTQHVDLFGDRLEHLPRVFRTDPSTALGAADAGSTADAVVTLTDRTPRPGFTLTHEFSLPANGSSVRLRPWARDNGDAVDIELRPDGYRVTRRVGGFDHLIHAREEDCTRITVRSAVTKRGYLALAIRDWSEALKVPQCEAAGLACQLEAAALISFSFTSMGDVDTTKEIGR